MFKDTKQLRIDKGKWEALKPADFVNDHVAHCQACGSTQPETLYPARPIAGGSVLFVGVTCLAVLTDNRVPSLADGEVWKQEHPSGVEITFVKPDKAMREACKASLTHFKGNDRQGPWYGSLNKVASGKPVTAQMYDNVIWLLTQVSAWES